VPSDKRDEGGREGEGGGDRESERARERESERESIKGSLRGTGAQACQACGLEALGCAFVRHSSPKLQPQTPEPEA